ncbi:MAG: hypothetical protein A2418_02175 [Candidatus Brennerbacteria bacterium RIFOXYC1_FULL_41_11]|uniref:Helix-turn-helix domain-containing protein n=1 Tax=Candidatus Brennerbacteria bacterium RIFOXYD1_FULL_41_16 TaxID=1797529 RepID=A0A1G1XLB6_9BACT|nr:MAG: hypothetical protein A2418_02175 [Candidatus Brennerbacteria bacterium RIFOXYC1_FULL_41_11]OGY40761.1 MAG: hypothetical protein A2570_01385 [Candidatus Brennerbacteria bacterium RIFOXYD1_FULL_41_16]
MVESTIQKPEVKADGKDENNYLGIKEVAKDLGVSKATILRWLQSGKLDGFFHIGRKWLIRRVDFEKFINLKVESESNK